jgi:hypothetical protein
MIKNMIKNIVSEIKEIDDIVRAVLLLGSYSEVSYNDQSDIDILIITHSYITPEIASIIGDKIEKAQCDENATSYFDFYNPVCERCKLLSSKSQRFHLIAHSWADISKWVNAKDFIACMWARKSTLLWGENPFDSKILPELNNSILDDLDGIPNFIREINNILITKNTTNDSYEYERYCKFLMARISEINTFFPDLSKSVSPPVHPIGKDGLIQLAKYFYSLEEVIKTILKKSANNGIKADK